MSSLNLRFHCVCPEPVLVLKKTVTKGRFLTEVGHGPVNSRPVQSRKARSYIQHAQQRKRARQSQSIVLSGGGSFSRLIVLSGDDSFRHS